MSKLALISAVFIVLLTFNFEFNFSNASSDDQDGFAEIEEESLTDAVEGGSCGLQNEG